LKNVIITGAGGVLGRSHIKMFLDKGWRVFSTEIDDLRLKKLNEQFLDTGLFRVTIADSRSEQDVARVFQEAENFFENQTNVLVNNAGFTMEMILESGNKFPVFEEMSSELWQTIIDANLTTCFLSCKEFVKRHKKSSQDTSIINIASMYALRAPHFKAYETEPFHCLSAYSASKAGVHGLTLWLSSYLREKGVRVNTLAPGAVYNGHSKSFQKSISDMTITGRMAEPKEISSMLTFLCSEKASYMNGQIIFCDGGYGAW
jgi:3-oxoacyl-[acyl-carrier protein] reductase